MWSLTIEWSYKSVVSNKGQAKKIKKSCKDVRVEKVALKRSDNPQSDILVTGGNWAPGSLDVFDTPTLSIHWHHFLLYCSALEGLSKGS